MRIVYLLEGQARFLDYNFNGTKLLKTESMSIHFGMFSFLIKHIVLNKCSCFGGDEM